MPAPSGNKPGGAGRDGGLVPRRCGVVALLLAGLIGGAAGSARPAVAAGSAKAAVAAGSAKAAVAAGSAKAAVKAVPMLGFDRVFATRGEPRQVHFQVTFSARGAAHRLEVWRDGDRRIRRATDQTLVSIVEHKPGEAGYRMTMLDLKRRISTRIDRTNLYRIGNFSDWFDLGHGLRHPKGAYRLTPAPAPAGAPPALHPCRWYALAQQGGTVRLCWDPLDRVPLLIVAQDGRVVWQMNAIDHRSFAPGMFEVHDRGFIHDDADRDISGD